MQITKRLISFLVLAFILSFFAHYFQKAPDLLRRWPKAAPLAAKPEIASAGVAPPHATSGCSTGKMPCSSKESVSSITTESVPSGLWAKTFTNVCVTKYKHEPSKKEKMNLFLFNGTFQSPSSAINADWVEGSPKVTFVQPLPEFTTVPIENWVWYSGTSLIQYRVHNPSHDVIEIFMKVWAFLWQNPNTTARGWLNLHGFSDEVKFGTDKANGAWFEYNDALMAMLPTTFPGVEMTQHVGGHVKCFEKLVSVGGKRFSVGNKLSMTAMRAATWAHFQLPSARNTRNPWPAASGGTGTHTLKLLIYMSAKQKRRFWLNVVDFVAAVQAESASLLAFFPNRTSVSVNLITEDLATSSVQEQAELYGQADIYIAPHGAHFANAVLFMRSGTWVFELSCNHMTFFANTKLPTWFGITWLRARPLSCASTSAHKRPPRSRYGYVFPIDWDFAFTAPELLSCLHRSAPLQQANFSGRRNAAKVAAKVEESCRL
jgi:hypothetical protein